MTDELVVTSIDRRPRLSIGRTSKTFGHVKVLHDVSLSVAPGEIHALIGQNGSGKSTLIKILTGLYTPDPGADYRIDEEPMQLPVQWRQVHNAGVSVVHQDLGLIDNLSVAENVCVGGFPTRVRLQKDLAQSRNDASVTAAS
ncbi:ATP-binding cassette domain-containing protein [Streptomyces sp. NPDC095613]|uniref:ATP-binding cassette domain-containing protein n=1 Tax=Streptomyces sp. NPDC095613 TaxID=3155540 RepID=UPI00333021AE